MPFGRLFGRQDPDGEPRFGPAPADGRPAALASILGGPVAGAPSIERRAAAQGIDLSFVWTAVAEGRTVASGLIVPHPGRTALLMTSAPRDRAHAEQVGGLVHAMLAECGRHPEIQLVQALASPGEALRAAAFVSGGMRHLATLEYMERPRGAIEGTSCTQPAGHRFEPWAPTERSMLRDLLQRTYVDTLDCPGLSEMRDPGDILEGHRAAGDHDPSLWTIAWRGDRPCGALLLAPSPATACVEVVYLGLAPEARGHGLGTALLAHGLALVANRPEPTVSLAVDSRNAPAIALYSRAGFRAIRRREAFVAGTAG